MKKIFFAITAAAFGCFAHAQDFEGTVVWKMRASLTDPAMQAAQAQLSSPDIQAKMMEAQAAMNTPEMQAMMAQNPQMRAMIEKSMAAIPKPGAANADSAGGMFPRGITLKAKGARTLVKVEGGMMPSETLTLGDQGVSYQLDRAAKTYQRLAPSNDSTALAAGAAFKITKTSDTAKVLGYTCTRYLVESPDGTDGITYSVWTTRDIKGLDPKKMGSLQVGRDHGPNFMSQLEGAPLKMDITTPQAKIMMEASSIKKESLADSTFAVPAGFTEVR